MLRGRVGAIGVQERPAAMQLDPPGGIGRSLDGAGELPRGLVEPALPLVQLGQGGMSLVELGLELDRLLQVGERLGEPAGLEVHSTPVHQQDIAQVVAWLAVEDGAIIGLGELSNSRAAPRRRRAGCPRSPWTRARSR